MYDFDQFKNNLKQTNKVNELYYLGSRVNNIKHAQLRMHCSKLNSHLYSLHVLDNPSCPCGSVNEDVSHYFYRCPLYQNQRQNLFQSIANLNITDWQMFLYGNKLTTYLHNINLHTILDNSSHLHAV